MIKKIVAIAFTLVLLGACQGAPSGSFGSGWRADGITRSGTQAWFAEEIGDTVYFDTDSSRINSNAKEILAKQAEWFNNSSHKYHLTLEGHCDKRGTREYNLALGERRANAVKKMLMKMGVPSDKLKTISYGKERPAIMGDGPSVWNKNRRVFTEIVE